MNDKFSSTVSEICKTASSGVWKWGIKTGSLKILQRLLNLNILIYSFSVDMLCITETWLNSDVTNAEVSLENYNIFRGDRQSGRRGGGVKSVFPLTSILIPPLQKLSRAKSPTHPNHSPYSEYTEVQPLRKLMTTKSSVPSALSPINRALVLSLEILTLHTRPNLEDCWSWCAFQEGSMNRSLLLRWNPIRDVSLRMSGETGVLNNG